MQRAELFNAIKSNDINHLIKMKESKIILDDIMKGKYGTSSKHISLAQSSPQILKFLIQWELDDGNWWYPDCMLELAEMDNIPLVASIAIQLGAQVNGNGSYKNHIIDIVRGNKIELCKVYINAGVDLSITYEGNGVLNYVKSHEMMDIILPHITEDRKNEYGKNAYDTLMDYKWGSINERKLRKELANRIAQKFHNKSKL